MDELQQRLETLRRLLESANRPYRVQELAEILAVSSRTVGYDLQRLRDGGFDIESLPGRAGGVRYRRQGLPVSSQRPQTSNGTPFIGYQRQRALLTEFIPKTTSTSDGLCLVSGQPGTGKSRLVEEVVARVALNGAAVAWGRCTNSDGAPPRWPWIQIIRSLGGEESSAPESLLNRRLLDVRGDASRAADGLATGNAREQFQLNQEIVDCLHKIASSRPLILVIEDIHWADEPSLETLTHLALNEPGFGIGVIATVRSDDQSRASGTGPNREENFIEQDLSRCGNFLRIELGGLSKEESAELVGTLTDCSVDAANSTDIYQLTKGNPLRLLDVARRASTAGDLQSAVRESTADLLADRLASLNDHDLEVLRLAALLGNRIDTDELIQVVGIDQRSAAIESLAELSRSHLLVAGSYGDAVEFEHDLTRQAIIGLIEPDHRQIMHAKIASGLAGLPFEGGNSASRIAHHWSSAGIHARPTEMHRWAIRAGEAALESFAYHEAIKQFLLARKSATNADERVDPLTGLAHAYQQTGQETEALECIREAFEHHMNLGMNQLAVGVAQMEFVGQLGQIGMVPIYQDALELAPAGSVAAARIMSCLSRPLGVHLNQYSAARELSVNAVNIARTAGDMQLELRILSHAIHIENFAGHPEIAKTHCDRVIELGREVEDHLALGNAHLHLSIYALRVGEIELAKYHSQRSIEHSLNTHNSERISSAYMHQLRLSLHICDWHEAMIAVDESLSYWPNDPRTLAMASVSGFLTGDAAYGDRYLTRFLALPRDQQMVEGSLPQWLPLIALVTGDPTHLALLKEALPDPGAARTGSSNPLFHSQTIAAHACIAIIEQNDETADSWLRQLEGAQLSPHVMALVPSLLAITGDHERALSQFQTLIAELERMNLWFGAGMAHFLFARFASKNSTALGGRRSRRVIERASEFVSRHGLAGLQIQIDALASGIDDTRLPSGLSAREAEVLSLLAAGLSNQQIAERLVLSRHTVIRHVSNIFAKTGARNRAEATRFAIDNELQNGDPAISK